MRVLLDGIEVLQFYKVGIFIFFVSALGLGWIGRWLFLSDAQRASAPKLSLIMGFGSILLVLLSLALVLLGRFWYPFLARGSILIPVAALLILMRWIRREDFAGNPIPFASFCLLVAAIMLVRLAFLKGLILPPYNDSPEHFMIVRDLLTPRKNPGPFFATDTIASNYYHLGFHSIAAWMSSVTNLKVNDSIMLLGQLFLVILPISTFLLVYSTTQNSSASIFAMLLSVIAWRMPAFAANWGKYPAIAGLSLFPAAMALWVLYWRDPERKVRSMLLLIIATAGVVIVHTRLIFCLILVFIAFLASQLFLNVHIHRLWKNLFFFLISVSVFLVMREYLNIYYSNGYYLALALVIIFLPFAFNLNPKATLTAILFIMGVWVMSKITIFTGRHQIVMLDRPFIEILLCIPLAFLGGLGCAGLLEQHLHSSLVWFSFFVISSVILVSFVSANSVYPDPCCNHIGPGDVKAIQWLDRNAPSNAVVWIAAFKPNHYMIATDGGAWIHALTGLNSNKMNFNSSWSSPNSLARICRPDYKNVYVYKGSSPLSFAEDVLTRQTWLTPVFVSGRTTIYKVNIACAQETIK